MHISKIISILTLLGLSSISNASEFLFHLSTNNTSKPSSVAEQSRQDTWSVELASGIEHRLEKGSILSLPLPNNRYIDSEIREILPHAGLIHDEAIDETRIADLKSGQGSVEIYLQQGKVTGMLVLDMSRDEVFRARFNPSGAGTLTQEDPDQYYCVRYPAVLQTTQDAAAEIAEAAPTPDLDTLTHLQSKPGVTNVLYINFWGGKYTSAAWNNGAVIDYTPFSQDADTNNFSEKERHDMWLAWAEVAEDYAPFNINVTTDAGVYAATPANQRVQIIATTTCDWYNACGAGGVAYVEVFGWGDKYGTGWAWNSGPSSLGMTLSHESGHQMGLHHDGNPNSTYDHGHGNWGPIMGGPFGKSYVQWSKGEYPGANEQEDDLVTIRNAVGEIADEAGDDIAHATPLALPIIDKKGALRPEGLGKDIDVYGFNLPTATTVKLRVGPPLGIQGETMGTSLSLKAQLIDASGKQITSLAPSSPPSSNVLQEALSLPAGTYHLILEPLSYDPDWTTGFGEYANGGYYSLTLDKERGPDLVATAQYSTRQVVAGGQVVTLSSTIANLGDIDAPGSTLRYFIADSPVVTPNNLQTPETQAITSLAPGASVDISQEVEISPNLPTGHHWMAGCVDAVSGESQTSNNCSKGVEIVVASGVCDAVELSLDQPEYSGYQFLKSQISVSQTNSNIVINGELYVESPAVHLGPQGTTFSVASGSIFSVTSSTPNCQ